LARHLFAYDAYWNPSPLIDAPALAAPLGILACIVVAGASVWAARPGAQAAPAFAGLVTAANLMISPVSQDYHYVMLLLPIVLLAGWARTRPERWLWAALALGVVLAGADLRVSPPTPTLLAYPKLYGAGVLWGLSLWGARAAPAPSQGGAGGIA
jgi:hypothetical protein